VKRGRWNKKIEKRWLRKSLRDEIGQTLTLHRYETNKQCGTLQRSDVAIIVQYLLFYLYAAASERSHLDAI